MTVENRIGFYSVKVISIFIISIIYFIVGSLVSFLLNDLLPEEENLNKISTTRLFFIISGIFGLIGIIFYIIRIMIKNIPFFFDDMYGFKYSLLKEASGGIIIS